MDLAIGALTQRYIQFSGRARRKEFWLYFLLVIILTIAATLIDQGLEAVFGRPSMVVKLVVGIGTYIPTIAVIVRRLHDTNRSGWWIFVPLIPVIGMIAYIVFLVMPGTTGENRFGPDPKSEDRVVA